MDNVPVITVRLVVTGTSRPERRPHAAQTTTVAEPEQPEAQTGNPDPEAQHPEAAAMTFKYGDRRHFQIWLGRWTISRWCSGGPCHLPEVAPGRHWIRVWRSRRRWTAKSITDRG